MFTSATVFLDVFKPLTLVHYDFKIISKDFVKVICF